MDEKKTGLKCNKTCNNKKRLKGPIGKTCKNNGGEGCCLDEGIKEKCKWVAGQDCIERDKSNSQLQRQQCKIKFNNDESLSCVKNDNKSIEFGTGLCELKNTECVLSSSYNMEQIKLFINPIIKKHFINFLDRWNRKSNFLNKIIKSIEQTHGLSFRNLGKKEKKIIKKEYKKLKEKYKKKETKKILTIDDLFNNENIHIQYDFKTQTVNVYIREQKEKIAAYKRGKEKGRGRNGFVYEFDIIENYEKNVEKSIYSIIVKKETLYHYRNENVMNESDVIQKIKQKEKKICNVIPLRKISEITDLVPKDNDMMQTQLIYIMRNMKNDVNKYFTELKSKNKTKLFNYKQISSITQEVFNQVFCLFNVDDKFIYTDLKPQNVGIDYDQDMSVIKTCLIDIGSVVGTDGYYIATFPCQKHEKGNVQFNNKNEKERCLHHEILFFIYYCIEILGQYDDMLFKISYGVHFDKKNVKTIYDRVVKEFAILDNQREGKFIHDFLTNFKTKYLNNE